MQPLSSRFLASAATAAHTILVKALLCSACLCATQSLGYCQTNGLLCTEGEGRFTRTAVSGVRVVVDAQKNSGFATRACEATLLWKAETTRVARDVWQADVDGMGIDLGLGTPVVAFQFKKSSIASSMTYAVYSLRQPPELLRTITGGDLFRAADTDLDGRIEIWTGDAKAADGFEGIPLANFESVPTIVMRFEDRRLMDVSCEFQSFYDRQIARLRAQLDSTRLSEFKASDGRLDTIPPWQVEKLRGLLAVKTRVLEIVWAYLYSGREQEAWQSLKEMWPPADLDRIRASIVRAREAGISSEVDGVSRAGVSLRKLKRVHVYDLTETKRPGDQAGQAVANFPRVQQPMLEPASEGQIKRPSAISLYVPPPPDPEHPFPRAGMLLDLVIDAAGKVVSAKLLNKEDEGPIGESLIAASGHWKFTPAMRYGEAVASHLTMTVSPAQ